MIVVFSRGMFYYGATIFSSDKPAWPAEILYLEFLLYANSSFIRSIGSRTLSTNNMHATFVIILVYLPWQQEMLFRRLAKVQQLEKARPDKRPIVGEPSWVHTHLCSGHTSFLNRLRRHKRML